MNTPRMLTEALRNLFRRPVTVLCPAVEAKAPPGFRGSPYLESPQNCIGCGLCARDCPSSAVEMVLVGGKKKPAFRLDMCTFCGQCKDSCPKKVIRLIEKPEPAVLKKNELRREPPAVFSPHPAGEAGQRAPAPPDGGSLLTGARSS